MALSAAAGALLLLLLVLGSPPPAAAPAASIWLLRCVALRSCWILRCWLAIGSEKADRWPRTNLRCGCSGGVSGWVQRRAVAWQLDRPAAGLKFPT